MATDTFQQPRFKFLSLPAEIRIEIYRLVLRQSTPVRPGRSSSSYWPDFPLKLSAQLLRTCRQIHAEGLPILYGENTFSIIISNLFGPPSPYLESRGLGALNGLIHKYLQSWPEDPDPVTDAIISQTLSLPCPRRFNIEVSCTRVFELSPIRDGVRLIVKCLQKLTSPRLEHVRLVCRFDSEMENTNQGNYLKQECFGILRTWFSRLHNVKEVKIRGLPKKDAEILKKSMQRQQTTEDLPPVPPPLIDRYEALKRYAHDIGFCEYDLRQALLAAERDDEDEFKRRKAAIFQRVKSRWEEMNKDKLLCEEVADDV